MHIQCIMYCITIIREGGVPSHGWRRCDISTVDEENRQQQPINSAVHACLAIEVHFYHPPPSLLPLTSLLLLLFSSSYFSPSPPLSPPPPIRPSDSYLVSSAHLSPHLLLLQCSFHRFLHSSILLIPSFLLLLLLFLLFRHIVFPAPPRIPSLLLRGKLSVKQEGKKQNFDGIMCRTHSSKRLSLCEDCLALIEMK